MRYLIAALSRADERVGRALSDLPPAASPQELLTALINDLAAGGSGLLLVMDDYHAIRNFAVHELVAFLLANQPPGFHLVIGTREDPPLPLARLRARDQITEIREHALRFNVEEGGAFFNRTMGLSLAPESVATLLSRTEGWITGLQLAGVALRQPAGGARLQSAADDFVAAFAGDDRFVVDYLMAEVLEREPESVRDFLRQTSILERLSAPLCDDLTGRDDSAAVLGTSRSRESLPAARSTTAASGFATTCCLPRCCGSRSRRRSRSSLHRRAAAWFETHGWTESAAQHGRLAAEASAPRRNGPTSHIRAPAADRAAQRARARGAAPDRRGLFQPGDRRSADHRARHREAPHQQHLRQAPGRQPDPGRRRRPRSPHPLAGTSPDPPDVPVSTPFG